MLQALHWLQQHPVCLRTQSRATQGCHPDLESIWRFPLWTAVAIGVSLGLGQRGILWLVVCKLIAQLLDFHHQLSVALPIGVILRMLAWITATLLVTLGDFVALALEVLLLLSLVHLARCPITAMIRMRPVADQQPPLPSDQARVSQYSRNDRGGVPPWGGSFRLRAAFTWLVYAMPYTPGCMASTPCTPPSGYRLEGLPTLASDALPLPLCLFGLAGGAFSSDVRISLPDIHGLPVPLASLILMLRLFAVLQRHFVADEITDLISGHPRVNRLNVQHPGGPPDPVNGLHTLASPAVLRPTIGAFFIVLNP